jgi:RNA polymerase sigma factor (sigma-70 family)
MGARPRSIHMSCGLPPFQRLIDAYREDVWRMLVASVGRTDAEDCFQETFISALRAYPKLRPSSNLRAWVLTIAYRKALDIHRARARSAVAVKELARSADHAHERGRAPQCPGAAAQTASSGSPTASDRDDALWRAVHELPERQRSAVVLRFIGDLPHREIAAAMGCSEQAARRSLHEGLTTLRKEVRT